jgi:hypothetical protein
MSCAIELEIGAGSTWAEFITRVVHAPSAGEPSAVMQPDVERLLREREALETTVRVESEMKTLADSNIDVALADSGVDVGIVSKWASRRRG